MANNEYKYPVPYRPIEGKTFSLFGKKETTTGYYQLIEELADRVLEKFNSPTFVLQVIQKFSKKKRILQRISTEKENPEMISYILHLLNDLLSEYTINVEKHLQKLPIKKFWDKRLRATREQYHLYMLEIELTNRIFSREFKNAGNKLALLPYCLKDFNVDCQSQPDDFDYRCKRCSKDCYQHFTSRLLQRNHIDAYIWMGASIRKKAKAVMKSNSTIGILGIACIPELVWGMRKCLKYKIPVVGLPLDANRCIRWMGNYHQNSVNLEQLEKLVT